MFPGKRRELLFETAESAKSWGRQRGGIEEQKVGDRGNPGKPRPSASQQFLHFVSYTSRVSSCRKRGLSRR